MGLFTDKRPPTDSWSYDRDVDQPDRKVHRDTVQVQSAQPFTKPLGSKVIDGVTHFPA